ncbi:FAD-dependent oxidoreductase [Aquipuribacter hungaricus]|uniref:FAD-dependent oxidoreductase n=1 Tax=Aquipuribacter hungaricus TaxID=545624 RepID=A0ABV7WMD0_9MICO
MTHVLVVGGGVGGLLTVQALLDRADDLASGRADDLAECWADDLVHDLRDDPADGREDGGLEARVHDGAGHGADGGAHGSGAASRAAGPRVPLTVTVAVLKPGSLTASRSGGLAMRYASTDPRADGWATRSAVLATALARRHAHVRTHVRTRSAVVVSRRGPVTGLAGTAVDPAGLGLSRHSDALLVDPSPQWDTCALLPRWAAALAADPRVRTVGLPAPLRSTADLLALHDRHGADVTVACLGLGAHVLGDTRLSGRLGVLLRGPLPEGTVHERAAVVDDDDTLRPRYTVPHRSGPQPDAHPGADQHGDLQPADDHLHVGGTYLPVDDPADWDDVRRLADRATAEVPALLADAADRFPALAGWRPDAAPWWHLRPVRDTVALGRVDPGLVGGRDVVVSHGWGGSGWTIGPAVAEETARSLLPGPATHGSVRDDADDPLATYGWWRP